MIGWNARRAKQAEQASVEIVVAGRRGEWVQVLPGDMAVRQDFKDSPVGTGADQCVSICQSMRSGNKAGKKTLFLLGIEFPSRIQWQKRLTCIALVGSVGLEWCLDLEYR